MADVLTDFVFPSFTDVYKFIIRSSKKIQGELEFKHHCITFKKTAVDLPDDDGFKDEDDDDDEDEDDDDDEGDMDITYSSIKKAAWVNCDGTKGLELTYRSNGSTDFGGFKDEDYASVKNALKSHQINLVKENLFVGFKVKKARVCGNYLELTGNGRDVFRYRLSENTSGHVDDDGIATEDPPKEMMMQLCRDGTFALRTLKF